MSCKSVTSIVELPRVGDIISSAGLVPIPVSYSRDYASRGGWTTYAFHNGSNWELAWRPFDGLKVQISIKDFKELEVFPFLKKVVVEKVFKNSILVGNYER